MTEEDYGFCPIMSGLNKDGITWYVPCGEGCAWFKKKKTVPYFEGHCAFLRCVS